MPIFTVKNLQKPIYFTIFIISACILINSLYFHYRIITANYPHEFREGVMVLTTQNLLDGINPYSLAEQPQHTNLYGIIYHLTTYPFASIFGSTLPVHRAVTGVFLILSCVFLFFILRRVDVPLLLSFTGAVIYYGHLVSFWSLIARPDTLGIFLFLAAIFIPWIKKFDKSSLLISSFLCTLVVFTKMYFVIAFPIIATYLFVFKSKRDAIIFTLSFLFMMTASVLIINKYFETYFINTFYFYLNIKNDLSIGLPYVISQIRYFSKINFGVVIVFIILLIEIVRRNHNNILNKIKNAVNLLNFLKIQQPLTNIKFDYFVFVFLVTSAAFIFKLGLNPGSFVDYIHHLISPFLLIIVFRYLAQKIKANNFAIFGIIIIFSLIFTLANHRRLVDYSVEWKNIENLVSEYKEIYGESAITSVLVKQNKYVYNSGHSGLYLPLNEPVFKKSPLYPKIKERLAEFNTEINNKIIKKKFDLIILDNAGEDYIPRDLLKKYYYQKSEMLAPMLFNSWRLVLEVWLPKK